MIKARTHLRLPAGTRSAFDFVHHVCERLTQPIRLIRRLAKLTESRRMWTWSSAQSRNTDSGSLPAASIATRTRSTGCRVASLIEAPAALNSTVLASPYSHAVCPDYRCSDQ